MASSVQVIGDEQLAATLHAAARDIEDLADAQARISQLVTSQAAVMAPRRTGALAGSLQPDPQPHEAAVASSLAYAGVIHYGWPRHNIAARPFADRAVQAMESQVVNLYLQDVQSALNRVKGA